MRHAGSRTVLLVLLSFLIFTTPPVLMSQTPPRDQAPAAEKKGSAVIRGQVVAADTGAPLSGIGVWADTEEVAFTGRPRKPVVTDDGGRFEAKELPAGEYMLFAGPDRYCPLYVPWTYGATRYRNPGKIITLAERQVVDKIVIALPRSSAISGRVVNEKGEPMAWVSVNAWALPAGGAAASEIGRPRQTDDFGRFRIFGLNPGRYYVKAQPEPDAWAGAPDARDAARYVATYYPNVLTAAESQVLTIDVAQEISDIEIVARRSRTFRVTGAVTSASASPARARVAYSRDERSWVSTTTNPDGSFTLSGLLPAQYTFFASASAPSDPDSEAEASDAVVVNVDQDLEGFILSMRRAARVAGHVVLDVGDEELPAELRVRSAPLKMGGYSPFGEPQSALVKPDGTFVLARLFGASVIGIAGVPLSIRQTITYKGKDITDLPTAFADNPNPRDLTIVLSNKGSEITGRVEDTKGTATRAQVILFSADERRWSPSLFGFRMTSSDAQGRFSVKGLRPDKYLVLALERSVNLAPFDADVFAKLASVATAVEVLENDRRDVSVTISKLPQ